MDSKINFKFLEIREYLFLFRYSNYSVINVKKTTTTIIVVEKKITNMQAGKTRGSKVNCKLAKVQTVHHSQSLATIFNTFSHLKDPWKSFILRGNVNSVCLPLSPLNYRSNLTDCLLRLLELEVIILVIADLNYKYWSTYEKEK